MHVMKIKYLLIIQLLCVVFLLIFLINEIVKFSREMYFSIKGKMLEEFLNKKAGSFRGIEYYNDTQIIIYIVFILFIAIVLIKTINALKKIYLE